MPEKNSALPMRSLSEQRVNENGCCLISEERQIKRNEENDLFCKARGNRMECRE